MKPAPKFWWDFDAESAIVVQGDYKGGECLARFPAAPGDSADARIARAESLIADFVAGRKTPPWGGASLSEAQREVLSNELAREDLAVFCAVRMARTEFAAGRVAETVAYLRVDADKLRGLSPALYALVLES